MSLLYRITCDGYTLLDQSISGYDVVAAELTREINDGMFDGTLEMTVFGTNPNLDKVREMASTILVTEIDSAETDPANREKVIFRGRPISIKPSVDYKTQITCEGDLKFLLDIPDVFSKMVNRSTVYKAGSEKKFQIENMRTIPYGDLRPGKDETSMLSRFGENRTYTRDMGNGNHLTKVVYRSEVTDYEEDPALVGKRIGYDGWGRTRYSNYMLQAKDVGKTFTVEWDPLGTGGNITKYELPLKTCTYKVKMFYGEGIYDNYTRNSEEVTAVARYLGNIRLIAGAGNNPNGFNNVSFNDAEEITVVGGNNVAACDLNFCIVQYSMAPHWSFSIDRYIFWSQASETIVYAVSPNENAVTSIGMKIYRNTGTTVKAMAHAILGRPILDGTTEDVTTPQGMIDESKRYRYLGSNVSYKENDLFEYNSGWAKVGGVNSGVSPVDVLKPQDMTNVSVIYHYAGEEENYQYGSIYCFDGIRWVKETLNYNSYVPVDRQIFLGRTELDADVEYSSVDKCYSNLRKWLEETGGYARVSEKDEKYYLDLLADSGEKSEDFYVNYGKNILDASETILCDEIVTGVYVKGVWKGEEDNENTSEEEGVVVNQSGKTQADPDYELLFRHRVVEEDVEELQSMIDRTKRYRYTGETYTYQQTVPLGLGPVCSGVYAYNTTRKLWVETDQQYTDEVPSVFQMTDKTKRYKYTGERTTYYHNYIYKYENNKWIQDTDASEELSIPNEFELDEELNIIWNRAAKEEYGCIVHYLEVDVANVVQGRRFQYMADKGMEELRNKLTAFVSFDIYAVDPRVIGLEGKTPILGNYYPIDIPWLGLSHNYQRLSKIVTNILDHTSTKLTLGNKTPLLSDYIAKNGERL